MRGWHIALIIVMVLWGGAPAGAAEAAAVTYHVRPLISLIIDDLGEQTAATQSALALPGRFNCAFLPFGEQVVELASLAHARNKEVMLHLPMEARKRRRLGERALTRDMTADEIRQVVQQGLTLIPHVRGINNHMGSLLTTMPEIMNPLMNTLQQHDGRIFFVDSRTTAYSIADATARQFGVPHLARDVFLDDQRSLPAIAKEFERLLLIARRHGSAVAIGHPYPETLAYLTLALPLLQERGYELVPVSEMLQRRQQQTPPQQTPLLLTAHPAPPRTTPADLSLD
ncbi:MAG: divergent polysaccharide deacetylase family protein [Gammaproteobacteria bacterium]|nr:divergent polysaccharide deacetylase family protein [Gammaproteobacteria bacterium]